MWIWIIIIAVIIGAIFGASSSEDGEKGAGAASGAFAGGMMAIGCLARLALAAISIFLIIWLFGAIFG